MRRSVRRHFLRETDVICCMVFHSCPNVLPNDAVASSRGHMTNNKLHSWNWKYFFRISDPNRDPDHVQNLVVSLQCHYLSCCQISSRSVHKCLSYPVNKQANKQTGGDEYIYFTFYGVNEEKTLKGGIDAEYGPAGVRNLFCFPRTLNGASRILEHVKIPQAAVFKSDHVCNLTKRRIPSIFDLSYVVLSYVLARHMRL